VTGRNTCIKERRIFKIGNRERRKGERKKERQEEAEKTTIKS
jgi:hypothetical protein